MNILEDINNLINEAACCCNKKSGNPSKTIPGEARPPEKQKSTDANIDFNNLQGLKTKNKEDKVK
jgi:hypothetical protein